MPGTNDFLDQIKNYGPIIGAGTQLIGSGMASGQYGRANDLNQLQSNRLFQLAQQERQRRDAMSRMLMPSMFRDMGMSPGQAQQSMSQMPSGNPSDPQYGSNYGPQLQNSGGGKVQEAIGAGVTGLGALGAAKS